ncbi:MAG: hypothetical protein M3T56_10240 [Chloroflexota bacterium]|nr:hypothetical protein [Chloroflexota bacterium]
MRIRRPLPTLPKFGRPAALLVDDAGTLALWVSPELDETDVKIAAYALAMRFPRFDRSDAVRAATIRDVRGMIERDARRLGEDVRAFVDRSMLGRAEAGS